MALIEAGLAPPPEPARLLARPRLQLLLEKVRRTRLTLVQAPAGYGKSSLLGQRQAALKAEGYCAGWVGLDASSNRARRENAMERGRRELDQAAERIVYQRSFGKMSPRPIDIRSPQGGANAASTCTRLSESPAKTSKRATSRRPAISSALARPACFSATPRE